MSTPNSGYTQYLREYRVTIKPKNKAKSIQISDLRCVFNCEKKLSETPNYSTVTLYNLAGTTLAGIHVGDTVILEAGYRNGNFGMIFSGTVIQPRYYRESQTDTCLSLVLQDGDKSLTGTWVSKSVAKNATQYDVVKLCIDGKEKSAGIISDTLSMARLPRGKIMFGQSSKYLKKAAKAGNSQFYVEDGKINIVAAASYSSKQAVELSPKTGLIGMPTQTDDGISGQCLINPSIKLATQLYINRNYIEAKQVEEGKKTYTGPSAAGLYKVTALTYEGDTHGDNWYCTFEAVAISGYKATKIKKKK